MMGDPVSLLDDGSLPVLGFVIAGLVGGALGGMLAWVMRWSARFFTRAVFACTLSPMIWLCVHLFFPWRTWMDQPPPVF